VIFDFLVSDYPILLTLLAGLWLLGSHNRSAVSWMWNDKRPLARRVSRVSIGAVFALALWVTAFDNWRQLIGLLVGKKDRWRSDPFLYGPPADAVRAVSFVLFGLAVLGGAYLFARYARGYLAPIAIWPVAVIFFFVLNSFRMRFELVGPLSPYSVDFSKVLDATMTFVWFGGFYLVMGLLIFCAYSIFWAPASILFAIIYRSTVGREKIEEPDMFRIMRERSAAKVTQE
jgi:hypothetical protein